MLPPSAVLSKRTMAESITRGHARAPPEVKWGATTIARRVRYGQAAVAATDLARSTGRTHRTFAGFPTRGATDMGDLFLAKMHTGTGYMELIMGVTGPIINTGTERP